MADMCINIEYYIYTHMKNKKIKFGYIALFVLLPFIARAQYGNVGISDIGVKGLRVGGKYTKNQVITAMGGHPTKYFTFTNDKSVGINESYIYDSSSLYFVEDGILVDFVIKTNTYPVFEQYNGGIRVGDPITKINQLGVPDAVLTKKTNTEYWFGANDDVVVFMLDVNNKITQISYNFSF